MSQVSNSFMLKVKSHFIWGLPFKYHLFMRKAHFHRFYCMSTSITQSHTIDRMMSRLTEITLPRADRDLLIFAPSFNLSPVAPVESALSLPVIQMENNDMNS